MNNLPQQYFDKNTGISYTLVGDYYLPDFEQPETKYNTIGRFGRERLNYLKNHRRLSYINLLTSSKLHSHLSEIEESAHDHMEFISKQIAEREGVTEKLKADDPILWVQRMNNILNRVTEVIRDELIYA